MKEKIKQFFDIKFWKFIAVGVVNTLVGTGIMFLFYNVFHFNYWVSSASNYVVGSIVSYILNRLFTFKSRQNTKKTLPRFVINITCCYLIAYGGAKQLALWILKDAAVNIQENVAMLIGMCVFVALNYIGQRFFVFKEKKDEEQ